MPFIPNTKAAARTSTLAYASPYRYAGLPWRGGANWDYDSDWSMDRAVTTGMRMTTWVFRSVDHIAKNQAGLPFLIRKDQRFKGPLVENNPLIQKLNQDANPFENSWAFRYRLTSQILLSRRGAFVEIEKSRRGEVVGLFLHNPGTVTPIPDQNKFVAGYDITVGKEHVIVPEDKMLWFKLPHPTDPYMSMTPLEACGLAVETEILAKQFNRNFLQNDGRPGGILAIKGELEDEDAEALRSRFLGAAMGGNGPSGAGRLTVLETGDGGGVDFVDTATTPRDAQHSETRGLSRDEILTAFGVPESIIGRASGRTFDNASVEQETFWRSTMLPHLDLLSGVFDRLLEQNLYANFDTSEIYVLDRDKREQHKFYLQEFLAGTISVDTYLEKTGQKPIGDDNRYIASNRIAYDDNGEMVLPELPEAPKPEEPVNDDGSEDDEPDAPARSVPGPTTNPMPDPRPSEARRPPVGEGLPKSLAGEFMNSQEFKAMKERAESQMAFAKMKSWERHISKQMEGFFRRQEKVVIEKLLSKKTKDKWAEDKSVVVEDIFDKARWDAQLADDASIWMNLLADDFDQKIGPRDIEVIVSENEKTKQFISRVLTNGKTLGQELPLVESAIKEVFVGAIHGRGPALAAKAVKVIGSENSR